MLGRDDSTAKDVGLLALRLVTGGLLAGHGAQKLFGAFGGFGLEGTAGWLESMGLKPGKTWAMLAGGGEFGSGLLMALGFLTPLGAIGSFGPMATAWAKVHAGKPIWVTSGGAELPLTNVAVATALALTGPGRYSLDEMLGIEVPTALVALAAAGVAAGVVASAVAQPEPSEPQANEAGGELQAGEDAGGSGADTALGESSAGA
jgi:putative oxidoreductase